MDNRRTRRAKSSRARAAPGHAQGAASAPTRRAQNMVNRRAVAARRREKATALAYGDAWVTIVYSYTGGYAVDEIYETKDEADNAAKRLSRGALEDSAYLKNVPYRMAFAVPVESKSSAYERGVDYHVVYRKDADPDRRAVYLYPSQDAAADAAKRGDESSSGESSDDSDSAPELIYIGGPIKLKIADTTAPAKKIE